MAQDAGTMSTVTECIHGLDAEQCDVCSRPRAAGSSARGGTYDGKRFALIYAPSIRTDTFLHLNREGDHWKIRWYTSPNAPAVEIAQSGQASTRQVIDLSAVEIVHEVGYPYSTSPGGVTVTDSAYWFREISKVNAVHGIGESEG